MFPVVLAVILVALVVMLLSNVPMLPEPEDKVSAPPVERLVAAASVMEPLPLALRVMDEPVTLALTAIPALVPACRVTAPEAVSVLPTVMEPPEAAVSVNDKVAPVEGA